MTEENATVDQLQVGEEQINEETTDLNSEEVRHEVVITIEGRDINIPMDNLELTMESTQNEVLGAVSNVIEEETGSRDGYEDAYNDYTYTVRKAFNTETIYVYPKPVAG